jgi:Transposase
VEDAGPGSSAGRLLKPARARSRMGKRCKRDSTRDLGALEPWLQEAEASGLAPFASIARSFRHDDDPIKAALTTPWSTGLCEGQIGREKLSKRLGYGRAKLDVLWQRILPRMVTPRTQAGRDRQISPPVAASGSATARSAWRPLAATYTQPIHASSHVILLAKSSKPHDDADASAWFHTDPRRCPMLRPMPIEPLPPATARGARAAFPKGNRYLRVADELETRFTDDACRALVPTQGQPAQPPWRLALVTILPFAAGLSDRQAAHAVGCAWNSPMPGSMRRSSVHCVPA